MSKRTTRALTALAVVVGVVSLPMVAAASHDGGKTIIGAHQTITGPETASGTFAAAGVVSDSGTVDSTFTLSPGPGDRQRIKGTQTFTGTAGTFETRFKGLVGPESDARQAGRGTFGVVSGTGAYAELTGHGTFVVVGDFTTGNVYSTAEGVLHP